ncbi:MAG: glycosyltransferase family A protein [Bacteroidales bacterium]
MEYQLYPEQKKQARTNIPSHPFFSVIITTYNRAGLLSRALDSLISQTEKDWEAVVVDDGSADNTYARIIPYLKLYPEIALIRLIHSGKSFAKNTGLSAANGRYITFLDSDDEFNPHHLESRKVILVQNPAVQFLYGGTKILGSQYVPDRFNYRKLISLKDCVIGGTFIIERNIALSLNGFRDLLIGSDADLFNRAKAKNINMMEVDQPTYVYHHETEDSVTNRLAANL